MSDNEKASVPDSTGEAAKAQGWTAYFVCKTTIVNETSLIG
jgi:hypothetical protein